MNWHELARLAQQHGVVPQVYSAAANSSGGGQALAALYQANVRQTLWLTGELLRILKKFEGASVEVLPYKGPVLAETLYGDVSMRQFSDLDLLVRRDDVVKIKKLLAEIGYEAGLNLNANEQKAHLKYGYEYTFNGPRGDNLIEIQWQILPRFYSVDFDVAGFFERAIDTRVNGVSVRTLSNRDLFLVLSVHAAKHAWVRLCWLCDLVELAKRDLDWQAIHEQARALGIQRIVAVTFLLARRLLAGQLPGAIERFIVKDADAASLADQIVPTITGAEQIDVESLAYFGLMLNCRERWKDRARFLWRLGITPSVAEWSAMRLPEPLFPLYRALRIGRVAKRLVVSQHC